MFNIYTGKKCSEYLDLFCGMNDMKAARPSKVLCGLGARITIYYSIHVHFLALMSFVTIIAKSINFDSIGKMQKGSRFSDCKSEPM